MGRVTRKPNEVALLRVFDYNSVKNVKSAANKNINKDYAPVAQWIERRPTEPKVGGSTPPRRIEICIGGEPKGVWGKSDVPHVWGRILRGGLPPLKERAQASDRLDSSQAHDTLHCVAMQSIVPSFVFSHVRSEGF
jgi:hypothetical protein